MTEILSDLRRIDLFASLSPPALHKLAGVARRVACDDGQIVMLEGDPDAPLFFVLAGTVRAYRTNLDGREQTLIHLKPGMAFNLPAAFAASPPSPPSSASPPAPASAVAVGPVQMLAISPADFRRVVSESPEIALAVLHDLSDKLRHLTDLTYDLSLRSVRGRLARFLLAQARREEPAPVHWTHEEIAAQIGTVREVVSRTLRAFVQDGLIRIERQRIVVLDPEALAVEAEG